MQDAGSARTQQNSRVDDVTFEEAAISASSLVLHLQAPCVRADVCQVIVKSIITPPTNFTPGALKKRHFPVRFCLTLIALPVPYSARQSRGHHKPQSIQLLVASAFYAFMISTM